MRSSQVQKQKGKGESNGSLKHALLSLKERRGKWLKSDTREDEKTWPSTWDPSKMSGFVGTYFIWVQPQKPAALCHQPELGDLHPPNLLLLSVHSPPSQTPAQLPNPWWLLLDFALGILCPDRTTKPTFGPAALPVSLTQILCLVPARPQFWVSCVPKRQQYSAMRPGFQDSPRLFPTAKAGFVWWMQQWARDLQCGLPGFPNPLPWLGTQRQTLTNLTNPRTCLREGDKFLLKISARSSLIPAQNLGWEAEELAYLSLLDMPSSPGLSLVRSSIPGFPPTSMDTLA